VSDPKLGELEDELELESTSTELPNEAELQDAAQLERELVEEETKPEVIAIDKSQANDGVYLYLREIGKIPPLAQGEELVLARIIEKGGAEAEKAKRKLVSANLKLVISVAKRYAQDSWNLLDLIQEGNLGLIKAAEKFDRIKGYKFSTCATWWIRQSISRSINEKSRSIRIPAHMIEQASRLRRIKFELTQGLGRNPTDQELIAALDIDLERLREIENLQMSTVSMSMRVGKDQESDLGEFIESNEAFAAPDAAAISKMLKDQLKKTIEFLSEEEQNVLILRYGLIEQEGERMYTTEEVAEILDIPKANVKKIEAKALRKLKGKILEDGNISDYI